MGVQTFEECMREYGKDLRNAMEIGGIETHYQMGILDSTIVTTRNGTFLGLFPGHLTSTDLRKYFFPQPDDPVQQNLILDS